MPAAVAMKLKASDKSGAAEADVVVIEAEMYDVGERRE